MNKIILSKDLEEIIPKFIENRKKEINNIEKLIVEGDFNKVAEIGHEIKGVSGGYGFDQISIYGREIEENALKNEEGILKDLCKKIESYFENLEIEYTEEEF